jgi:SH3 domain protein
MLLVFCLASIALAEDSSGEATPYLEVERYISDTLLVPLRSGAGNQYRILHKGLSSGTIITLLKTDESSGWSLVRTGRGIEGWIRSQYLESEPTNNIKLARAEKTISQLSGKAGPLSEKLIQAENDNTELSKQIKVLELENSRNSTELERITGLSGNVIALDEENKNLLKDHESLKHERDTLKADNTRLKEQLKNDDFMYGAYAILLGIIATLVIQYFANTRRRNDWG